MNLLDLFKINMQKLKNKKDFYFSLQRGIKRGKWFSFIELIIVISIISIIWVFWISSFSDQIDNLKAKATLWKIISNIDNLDNKVNSRKIFDYEIIFEKNKTYYLVNENIFDLENKMYGVLFNGSSILSDEVK